MDFAALHAGTEALAIAASEQLDAVSVAGEVELDLVCGECRAELCLYWSAEERVVWVLDGDAPQPALDDRGAGPFSDWLAEGARLLDETCTPGGAVELTSLRSLVLAASSLAGLRDRQLAAQLLLPYRPFACPSCRSRVVPFDVSGATGAR
ncbi:MAG: hypothetical protein KF878_05135 [Planctomycetes bacterium]|nr:hypothetical protein [Planctomycetota bacterium]